jgi:hypothetical protein
MLLCAGLGAAEGPNPGPAPTDPVPSPEASEVPAGPVGDEIVADPAPAESDVSPPVEVNQLPVTQPVEPAQIVEPAETTPVVEAPTPRPAASPVVIDVPATPAAPVAPSVEDLARKAAEMVLRDQAGLSGASDALIAAPEITPEDAAMITAVAPNFAAARRTVRAHGQVLGIGDRILIAYSGQLVLGQGAKVGADGDEGYVLVMATDGQFALIDGLLDAEVGAVIELSQSVLDD